MDLRLRIQRLLTYLGMSAVFCVCGYVILGLALLPLWAQAKAYLGFLVSSEAPSFNQELTNVYDPSSVGAPKQADGYISARDIPFPNSGEQYGHLECEELGLDAPVFWYDSDDILLYGVGQSIMSTPPGYGSGIVISGHNTTFFRCLEYAKPGQVIKFHTNWCDYEYTVTHTEIYDEDALETVLVNAAIQEHEELILYACYPFYPTVGRKTDRFVLFADRTAGTDVKWRGLD